MSSYSTLQEIQKRGKIVEIDKSKIRVDCFIITFENGSQANCSGEVYNQLNNK